MVTNLSSCLLIQFLELLLKFLVKLYFVEISQVSEKLFLFNNKKADFLASKFWNFFTSQPPYLTLSQHFQGSTSGLLPKSMYMSLDNRM